MHYIKMVLLTLGLGLFMGCAQQGALAEEPPKLLVEKDGGAQQALDSGQPGVTNWNGGGYNCLNQARNIITRVTPIPDCPSGTCRHLPYTDIKTYYRTDVGPNGCGPNGCNQGYKDEFTDTNKFSVTEYTSAYTGNPSYGRKYRVEVTSPFLHEITFPHGVNFSSGVDQAARDRLVIFTPFPNNTRAADGLEMYTHYAGFTSGWMLKDFTNTHITIAKRDVCESDAQGYQVEVTILRHYGRQPL